MQVRATRNQSILDLAIQAYGTASSLPQVLKDNFKGDYELSSGLVPGMIMNYNIENGSANKRVLRTLNGRYVMAFNTTLVQDELIITEDGFNIMTEDNQTINKE